MSTRAEVLITADELAARLPEVQLLDVRWRLGDAPGVGEERYLTGHLPGAVYLDLEAVLTGPTTDPGLGRHPLPDAGRLAAGLGALGIDPARPIVVYDYPGSFAAGRAWWVLRWAGLSVRVLDGGIKAWQAAGHELVAGPAQLPAPTELVLTTGHLPTIDTDQAATFPGMLIDVRAEERFTGEQEPVDPRPGHIPGAVNRPVAGFWDAAGRLPEAAELLAKLALEPGRPVAVYCGSGVSAAQVLLALASLGIEAPLYPASWSGWSADPARPAALGRQ